MKSGNYKGFSLSEATPVKHERHEFQIDSAHTSSGKGDTAFQLYCQQNLSPINNFGFGKAAFLHSPALMPQKNFGKSKSVFSPGLHHHHHHHGHNPKYNPAPHYPSGQQHRAASGEQYPAHMKDEFEANNYHQHHLKRAATPLGDNRLNATPTSGKYFSYQNQIGSTKPLPQAVPGKHSERDGNRQDYIFQSPVFKIRFKGREQLDLFLKSEAMNRDQIDRVSFEGSSSKVVVSKPVKLEYENSQNSYQRVIQFNDENEEDEEQVQSQDEEDNEEDQQQEEEENNIEEQSPNDQQVASGVIQMPILGNRNEESGRVIKSLNLFEEPSVLLSAYDSQMTFNPYGNYHESAATTVKKPILEKQQSTTSHHDLRLTASKTNGNQKRKLFDSPSFKNDRDLHTPSTKKKKAPSASSSAQFIPGAHTNTQSISNSKNQDEKQIDKLNAPKQSDKEQQEEDREFKQTPAPFALPACEEKKICCNCKRTKCLKLYCECFAASRVCEGCSCQGCFNKPEFEHLRKEARNSILERNSSAFDPKIEAGKTQVQETEEGNPESDQKVHSKGCNCKKSNCLKKYCECFQLGVKCSKLCKCESCKNTATTSATYSDDGDYQMSASAIKSSERKSHGRDHMNEYSQYNQFNYFHPNHYYPYYYPSYPYNQYPFMGDYYMVHPEDGERTLGNPIDTYPYEQMNLTKNNKKHRFQQQLMASEKKGMIQGNPIAEEGYYGRFPAPPLDKKRKIMEQSKANLQISKEIVQEDSSSEEELEDKKIFQSEFEEEDDDQSKEKIVEEDDNNDMNNEDEEEEQEQQQIEEKQIHQVPAASSQHEKFPLQAKHQNNLENNQLQQETITFNEQMKEDKCCPQHTHTTENSNDKSTKNNGNNASISEEIENIQQRKSDSKNKKHTELPKRELSKRGSAQKSTQVQQVKNTRSQDSNKKKAQQEDEKQSEDVSDHEKEQPQAEMKNHSIKKEENRIVTRHSEEKAKNKTTITASSRPKRNK